MQKQNSLDFVKLPQLKEPVTTRTLLAHCMWNDEQAAVTREADLHRVSDGTGNEWWEVDCSVTSMALDSGEPEVTHEEFDDELGAYSAYLEAVQITVTAK